MRRAFPVHKTGATEIVVLGCGPSLDLAHPDEYEPTPDRIVIAVNAACCLVDADYVASIDQLSVRAWWRHVQGPRQYYVTGSIRRDFMMQFDVKTLIINDYLGYAYGGSGSIALGTACILTRYLPKLQRIVYIGLDCSEGSDSKGKTWTYAHRLKPYLVAGQVTRVRPDLSPLKMIWTLTIKNQSKNPTIQEGLVYSYLRQLNAYWRLFNKAGEDFTRLLVSRSHVDIVDLCRGNWPTKDDFKRALRKVDDRSPKEIKPKPRYEKMNRYSGGYDLPVPRSKMKANLIWLIGCGPSLDITRPTLEELDNDHVIVITVNAAIALYREVAAYQVVTDAWAFEQWAKPEKWPVWIVPRRSGRYARDGQNWRAIDDLMPIDSKDLVSTPVAFMLAHQLLSHPQLAADKLLISGVDFASVRMLDDMATPYNYASCLRGHVGGDNDRNFRILADNWHKSPHKVSFTTSRSYQTQVRKVADMLRQFESLRNAIGSRSYCDFLKLKRGGVDSGWTGAVRNLTEKQQ